MRVEQRDSRIEKKIVTALIVSKEVLGKISTIWNNKQGPFNSQWSNIVGNWCISHWLKYGEAPKKDIQSLYEHWGSGPTVDKESAKLLERFLDGLSGDYEALESEINPDYILDQATTHFNKVKLARLREAIENDIEIGKPEDAIKRVSSFSKIEIGSDAAVNVLTDKDAIRKAFESKKEPLITFRGALGEFFGSTLERDGFVAFVAPDKVGKSYTLREIAWQGMLQRRKVAHFIVGDMSQDQVMRQYMIRATRRPLHATKRAIRYPISIKHYPDEKFAEVEFKEKEYKDDLDWRAGIAACEKVMKTKVKSKHHLLRLSCHAGGSISALGLRSILEGWERIDWSPDIIVIDYADNLAAINGKEETRHQINETWLALRSVSQQLHCLVVTATQSSAKAYDSYLIKKQHFSENKMKNAHVTAMVGINQMPEEKENDVIRFNWVVNRNEESSPNKCVFIAGCRGIGNIAIRSTW